MSTVRAYTRINQIPQRGTRLFCYCGCQSNLFSVFRSYVFDEDGNLTDYNTSNRMIHNIKLEENSKSYSDEASNEENFNYSSQLGDPSQLGMITFLEVFSVA